MEPVLIFSMCQIVYLFNNCTFVFQICFTFRLLHICSSFFGILILNNVLYKFLMQFAECDMGHPTVFIVQEIKLMMIHYNTNFCW